MITKKQQFTAEVELGLAECYLCGAVFAFGAKENRGEDGNSFYCPNGHSQKYGETAQELIGKLKDELEAAKRLRTGAEVREAAALAREKEWRDQYVRVSDKLKRARGRK